MIDNAQITSLTIMTMEDPCCNGLLLMTKKAVENAEKTFQLPTLLLALKEKF